MAMLFIVDLHLRSRPRVGRWRAIRKARANRGGAQKQELGRGVGAIALPCDDSARRCGTSSARTFRALSGHNGY